MTLLVIMSLVSVVVSCGGKTTTTTTSANVPAATQPAAQPTRTPQRGGDFKILFSDTPKNMGWPGAPASGSSLHMPSCCVEGLIALDRDASGKLAPWLATSW
jgi:ABC-type transport system substrate-binding protein